MTKPHQWLDQIGVAVTAYNLEGQVIGTWNFAYDPSTLALTNETIVAGGVTNVIARTYDSQGRSASLSFGNDYQIDYGYSGVGRFDAVDSVVLGVTNNWQYSYLQDSELISVISNQQSVITTKSYEKHRNLLTEVHNKSQSVTISKYQYSNDALGRRTQRVDTTVSVTTNDFGYNARSELTNAVMGSENFAWAFDNIGNRETYTHPTGSGQTTNLYTANELNQYTSISNGGVKTLTYDLDGNLVTDGTWSNVWNGENRPVLIEPMNPSNGAERVELAYDYQGRRIKEEISVYSGSAWSVVRTNLWLYDGWNPVQEVVLTASGTETNWWTHGLDLSGTLQGAGGIGGFLAWTRASDGKTFLYSGDANGNITELVDASNPTNIVASYQWDAYGDPISMFGSEAENNVFRWSSKYVIVQTGDKDYGYRILRDHRWLSRDPIGEWSDINASAFMQAGGINNADYLGLLRLWHNVFSEESERVMREILNVISKTYICECDEDECGYCLPRTCAWRETHSETNVLTGTIWREKRSRIYQYGGPLHLIESIWELIGPGAPLPPKSGIINRVNPEVLTMLRDHMRKNSRHWRVTYLFEEEVMSRRNIDFRTTITFCSCRNRGDLAFEDTLGGRRIEGGTWVDLPIRFFMDFITWVGGDPAIGVLDL